MSASNTDTGDTTSAEITIRDECSDVAPREALITTAINFLQNAKVRHTTLLQKQQFLRSKGLTSEEIQLACERSGVFTQDPNNPQTTAVINMGISSQAHSPLGLQPRQNAFGRIKEILHSVALLSGLAYSIVMFWKKFIAPFLFGKKKRKPIDKSLEDIEQKVDTRIVEVGREINQLKDSIAQQQREQSQNFNREFNNFRSDLEAIKGLLLNRKQFAAPMATSGAASIPAWQLAASSPAQLHRHRHSHDDNEKHDDAGSGSGSSETEVVTKNSDSSLEIM